MSPASFDKIALLYNFVEKHIWEDYTSACDIIDEYLILESEEKIIDVGGGTGLISKVLRSKKQNDDIMVIDLSRSMLQKVKDPTLTVVQGDITTFPLKDEAFTLAVLVNTIHHISEAKQQVVLREVFRILKKQGRIFILEISHPNTFFSNLFIKTENILVGKTYHLTADKMQLAVQDAGFHEIKVFFPKKYPYRYVTTAIK
ncbi:Ubiquinone/menaquinone biosynthesis C-methyltransferase UbiE [uncultured archaeon]|nr:Ubiquinone/menaquinone biosynthesis C-methyltransferase UbiE [uncultured archaeon]